MNSNLRNIGINAFPEYANGNFYGNSSQSGYETFLDVTHNISDLMEGFQLKYQSRRMIKCNYASCFKTREIGDWFFGRCFEIEIENGNETISYIRVYNIKMPVYIFINSPHVFYNGIPSTKFQANTGETLFIEASYQILQTNFNDDCKKYPPSYNQSFDACKLEAINKNIDTIMNCSVPFIFKPNRTAEICRNVTVAQRASDVYQRDRPTVLPECPVPCVNMITSFGYPSITKRDDNKGQVYIFFKNLVKVTNDFISYDLLRFISIIVTYHHIDIFITNFL